MTGHPAATPRRTQPTDRGQAAVEFALVLPLVVLAVATVFQAAALVADHLAVGLAARNGARAAAASAHPTAAASDAAHGSTSRAVSVGVSVSASAVSVTVTLRSPTRIPLVGHAIRHAPNATATMRREPP